MVIVVSFLRRGFLPVLLLPLILLWIYLLADVQCFVRTTTTTTTTTTTIRPSNRLIERLPFSLLTIAASKKGKREASRPPQPGNEPSSPSPDVQKSENSNNSNKSSNNRGNNNNKNAINNTNNKKRPREQQDEQQPPPPSSSSSRRQEHKQVVIIGAGWGGLSAAYWISKHQPNHPDSSSLEVTVVDAAPRVGGLVRDGYRSKTGQRKAEAGQHGFWDQYYNIFQLLRDELQIIDNVLTDYAEQGQYSRARGLEAIWPVYRNQVPRLPTGLAQAAYTKFQNLPWTDRATAFPLVLAFSEFDDSPAAWQKYDALSFRDLCMRLGVSRRCYDEAFEPMILTGLFAPGAQVSAAAALGMAYFFVLSNQNAFDVRWCKGNIGELIFDPWIQKMQQHSDISGNGNCSDSYSGVHFQTSTRVVGFDMDPTGRKITGVQCLEQQNDGSNLKSSTSRFTLPADVVIFAVGAAALQAMVRNSANQNSKKGSSSNSVLRTPEFRRFTNLRGTSVLATRLYLDRPVPTPYTANACWGFDPGVGMTFFNIGALHEIDFRAKNSEATSDNQSQIASQRPQAIIEVDYYHSDSLLVMTDDEIVEKAKRDLDDMLGPACQQARIVDAAIVRLPNAVNWYYPDSYKDMPDLQSQSLDNVYFCGDLVRNTDHGSWSQEKAYVSGKQVANLVIHTASFNGRRPKPGTADEAAIRNQGIIPLPKDEAHVALGRWAVGAARKLFPWAPSPVDFLF